MDTTLQVMQNLNSMYSTAFTQSVAIFLMYLTKIIFKLIKYYLWLL